MFEIDAWPALVGRPGRLWPPLFFPWPLLVKAGHCMPPLTARAAAPARLGKNLCARIHAAHAHMVVVYKQLFWRYA